MAIAHNKWAELTDSALVWNDGPIAVRIEDCIVCNGVIVAYTDHLRKPVIIKPYDVKTDARKAA